MGPPAVRVARRGGGRPHGPRAAGPSPQRVGRPLRRRGHRPGLDAHAPGRQRRSEIPIVAGRRGRGARRPVCGAHHTTLRAGGGRVPRRVERVNDRRRDRLAGGAPDAGGPSRAVAADADSRLDRRRLHAQPAPAHWMDLGAAPAHPRQRARRGGMAADGDPALAPSAHPPRDHAARVVARRRADGDRMAEAGRSAPGQRARRVVAATARSDSRARARAHPAARLPGQPAADAGRNAPLLSPRGLVALATHPHRARELLRRSRRQPVRRSGGLRQCAGRPRVAALRGFRLQADAP